MSANERSIRGCDPSHGELADECRTKALTRSVFEEQHDLAVRD